MDSAKRLKKPDRQIMGAEIAARDRDLDRSWLYELDYPDDPRLRHDQWDWSIYEAPLLDDQVYSTFQQRRLAVVSREYEVVAGGTRRRDQQAADFIAEIISEPSIPDIPTTQIQGLSLVGWDALTDRMLYGRYWGFAVAELMFARDGKYIYPERIKVRKQQRFRFDMQGRLRLLTREHLYGEAVEELYPGKFWTFRCGGSNDDDPYAGMGLAPILYWCVWFKKNAAKLWAKYLEGNSYPRVVGKYSPAATEAEKATLLAAVDALREGDPVTMPEGMVADLLEATNRSDSYEQFVAYWDRAIAKVVLGQTMTSEAVGGQYKGDIQMEVRKELTKADADLINGSANLSWVRHLTEWNFPGAAPPRIWRRLDDEPDLLPQAERDAIIVGWGYMPKPEYVASTYGDNWLEPAAPEALTPSPSPSTGEGNPPAPSLSDALPMPSPLAPLPEGEGNPEAEATFAEPTATEDAFFAQLQELANPEFTAWFNMLSTLLAESASLEEFEGKLLEAFPDLDGQALTRTYAQAMFASKLAGIYEAQEGE